MKSIPKLFLILMFILMLSRLASAKATINGNAGGLIASGVWGESHEGVSLFCVHVINAVEVIRGHSEASCFLTEIQAIAKDSPVVTTSLSVVQTWDSHGLTAITTFYTNKNGDQTTATDPDAVKYTFKLVVDFDAHSVAKYVETPAGTRGYHLK